MTQIKEKAVAMIERMPEDTMIYVIDILQNIEAISAVSENEKKKSLKALQNLLLFEKRLSKDFDAVKELAQAREEKYGYLN